MKYTIRTSDRISFRRCRRRWGWTSHLRRNRTSAYLAEPLWTGTAFHFCMEDYHGLNRFGNPLDALSAFVEAYSRTPELKLPDGWKEEVKLLQGMIKHYTDYWLPQRSPLTTYIIDGVPQVEVNFEIRLPIELPWDPEAEVFYVGRIDRVVIDSHERLWVLDYKTAKAMTSLHLEIDQQMTTYCWASNAIYDLPTAGFIYQQHRKALPEAPTFLASGRFSVNKSQKTTRAIYKEALLKLYGEVITAPKDNVEFLNHLASLEQEHSDGFVQRNFESRNEHQLQAEGTKILLEAPEMLNPDTPLYPNPTRDCGWCDFYIPCVSMDDGSDWEYEIEATTRKRSEESDPWRQHLVYPTLVDLSQVS